MRELNEKMVKFCEQYVANSFNGTLAYKFVYETDNDNVAAVEANRLLKDIRIVEKIKEVEDSYRIAGHKIGINKQAIMNAIARMLNATKIIFYNGVEVRSVEDYTAINNAITTYAKLTGDFAPEEKKIKLSDDGDVKNISKLTKEEREEYKAKILAEL